MDSKYRHILLSLLLSFSLSGKADDLSLSGFGSLAFALSDSEQLGYKINISRDDGGEKHQPDFSELSLIGLHLDYQVSDNTLFVGQVVASEYLWEKPASTIRMAFLRYQANPQWFFRAGRMPSNLFMMSDFVDVTMAYPWVNLPTEVYGVLPYDHFDGVDATYQQQTKWGLIRTNVFWGQSETDFFGNGVDLSNIRGIAMQFEKGALTVSANHSVATLDTVPVLQLINPAMPLSVQPFIPLIQPFLNQFEIDNNKSRFMSLGLRYHFSNWLLQSELTQISSKAKLIDTVNAGYLSLTWNSNKHNLFLTYSAAKNNPVEIAGLSPQVPAFLQDFLGEIGNAMHINQHTSTLGWRYDFKDDLAITLQYDRVNVKPSGSGLWAGHNQHFAGDTFNVLKFSVGFTF